VTKTKIEMIEATTPKIATITCHRSALATMAEF
jgi:hypothetical protein